MADATTLVPEAAKPSAAPSGASALLEAHKEATGNGGTPRRVGGRPRKDGSPAQPRGSVAPQPAPPPPPVFTEDSAARVVSLPFTLAAVATNYDRWALDDRERRELAASGCVVLNEFVRTDPKWVGLCLFSVSLAGIAIAKAIEYNGVKRARAVEAQARKEAEERKNARSEKAPGKASGFSPGATPDPPTLPS